MLLCICLPDCNGWTYKVKDKNSFTIVERFFSYPPAVIYVAPHLSVVTAKPICTIESEPAISTARSMSDGLLFEVLCANSKDS